MIAFTIHEPPNPPADRIERAERLEFVRDGFTPLAAAIPPLWMVLNRLWMVLLVYLLVSTAASMGLAALGVDKSLIGLINLAANIVIGFEASSLQRWTLSRRDWVETGTVVGRNRAECERRFFDGWLVDQPVLRRGRADERLATPSVAPTPAVVAAEPTVEPPPAEAPAKRALWRRLLRR